MARSPQGSLRGATGQRPRHDTITITGAACHASARRSETEACGARGIEGSRDRGIKGSRDQEEACRPIRAATVSERSTPRNDPRTGANPKRSAAVRGVHSANQRNTETSRAAAKDRSPRRQPRQRRSPQTRRAPSGATHRRRHRRFNATSPLPSRPNDTTTPSTDRHSLPPLPGLGVTARHKNPWLTPWATIFLPAGLDRRLQRRRRVSPRVGFPTDTRLRTSCAHQSRERERAVQLAPSASGGPASEASGRERSGVQAAPTNPSHDGRTIDSDRPPLPEPQALACAVLRFATYTRLP